MPNSSQLVPNVKAQRKPDSSPGRALLHQPQIPIKPLPRPLSAPIHSVPRLVTVIAPLAANKLRVAILLKEF